MYLIKGYNVVDKDQKILKMIRFSAFSNYIAHTKEDLEGYRKELSDKHFADNEIKNRIVFISFNIPAQSKDATILKYYLKGKNNLEIAKLLEMQEDDVERIVETYIHGSKI